MKIYEQGRKIKSKRSGKIYIIDFSFMQSSILCYLCHNENKSEVILRHVDVILV